MSGWIKAHRALCDWEWYKDANTFRVFMHLLLNANYESTRYMGVPIPKGALPTGRNSIASALGITPDKVRTALEHLHSTNEITQQIFPKFSVITIANWDSYQSEPQQIPSKSPANPQQIPTLKEVKKERSKEIPPTPKGDFVALWNNWNPYEMVKGNKAKAEEKYQAALELVTHEVLIERAVAYCAQCHNLKTKTQHVATWLHQRGWETEYQPPPTVKTGFARAGL